MSGRARTWPVGAEPVSAHEASVRVWAPAHAAVDVVVDGAAMPLLPEPGGYFSATVPARTGARYGFRLPGDTFLYPDPASRSQPDGPEQPSAIVDLAAYAWNDAAWPGISLPGQVIYELHVGTFTPEGTWSAAARRLPRLRDLGVTIVQMMPVAEFAGAFGWGYDGVQWFAPQHTYGTPADLQAFVDAAHQAGLAVILDVVYNHLGPAGNFLARFSPHYFTDRYGNEWGQALDFDGEHASGMRELVLSNAAYWIREYHVDGFRLDAAQQIFDHSDEHILAALARTARATAAPRSIVLVAEHEPQHAVLLRPRDEQGYGLDGLLNEDFHHTVRVALTGHREAYLSDYAGTSREWLAAVRSGFLFQGQHYRWQRNPRGAPALDRPPYQFVNFIENHDQVANSVTGRRLIELTSPAWWRALSSLLLLGPWTPLLFQGQEWGSRRPFHFFADHAGGLQQAVLEGRAGFLSQFTRAASAPLGASPDAIGREAFEASRLDDRDAAERPAWTMYRDLLALRRGDPSLGQHATRLEGATLGDRTLLLRFFGGDPDDDRLLVVNLDPDLDLAAAAEPLVAPPSGTAWAVLWCSEDVRYGGSGIAACDPPARILATGHATTVFHPRRAA